MKCRICASMLIMTGLLPAQGDLREDLEACYGAWRQAMLTQNEVVWQKVTAAHRRMEVKNRILSEKKPFPKSVFELPGAPPPLAGMKYLATKRNGPTAKSYYFGKIDFGVGPLKQDNLFVLSFVGGGRSWFYDRANFINLAALPDVKGELAEGKLDYLDETPELLPSGRIPILPVEVQEAPYIAKVYVYCPGRDVRVQINRISQHHFISDQSAELVMGGALNGLNEVQFSIQTLPSDTPVADPLTIRIYLLSQVAGVKPIKAYEYLVTAGQSPKSYGKGSFEVDVAMRSQVMELTP